MSAMQEVGGIEHRMQSYNVSQIRHLAVIGLTLQVLVWSAILLRVRGHLEAMPLPPI